MGFECVAESHINLWKLNCCRLRSLGWKWLLNKVNLICHMGCGTKMSKFLRHMNALSWIRKCHPFHHSNISFITKKFSHPEIVDNSVYIMSCADNFFYAKFCFSLLHLHWSISMFLQNKRRPAALRSQRWAKGLCHPAYLCPLVGSFVSNNSFVSVLLTRGSFICKNSFISVLLYPLMLHLSLFSGCLADFHSFAARHWRRQAEAPPIWTWQPRP